MNERLGKILYGSLFAVVLPALLVLWARAAAPNVGLPAVALAARLGRRGGGARARPLGDRRRSPSADAGSR